MNLFIRGSALLDTLSKRKSAVFSDGLDIQQILQHKNFAVIKEPFPHIVVDDFFTPVAYAKLVGHFQSVLNRGLSDVADPHRFQPFLNLKDEHAYDGYLYAPKLGEPNAPSFFYSLSWNLLFSRIFGQPTGWCTSMAYHYHTPNNRTGFVHNDYAERIFAEEDRISNGVIYRAREGEQPVPTRKEKRAIALIYYLNNDEWKEGDGGETALYKDKKGSPVTLVAPKNNRLLAFQISPKSFHAFQKNNAPRSSIVQWFHVNEDWARDMYGFL